MQNIKHLLKLILIFLFLLTLFVGGILYIRPDIKPIDIIQDWKYWIIPLALLYVVFNFKRLIFRVINKIIFFSILLWLGYYFYPNIMKSVTPYLYDSVNTDSIKGKINELATPKDGTKPVMQISNENKIEIKPENRSKKDSQNKKIKIENTPVEKTSNEKINDNSIKDGIKELVSQPLSSISSISKEIPENVKNTISKFGIDIENPQKILNSTPSHLGNPDALNSNKNNSIDLLK